MRQGSRDGEGHDEGLRDPHLARAFSFLLNSQFLLEKVDKDPRGQMWQKHYTDEQQNLCCGYDLTWDPI